MSQTARSGLRVTTSVIIPENRQSVTAVDGNLVVGSDPVPEVTGRLVLVRICATALNRADVLQAKGAYPLPPNSECGPVLGLEMAGEVVQVGPDCELSFNVGDRVMSLLLCDGYSQYCAVDERMLMRVPRNLNWHKAAGIPETWLTAYQLLFFVGRLEAGMTVLIHAGASGVGLAATQLAVDFGATVLVTTGSEAKIKRCVEMGATAGFNYKDGPFAAGVMEATEGKGVNMVLDCVGGTHAEQNAEVLCVDGVWVLFGLMGGAAVTGPVLGWLLRKRIRLEGTTLRFRPLEYKIRLTQAFVENALGKFNERSRGLTPGSRDMGAYVSEFKEGGEEKKGGGEGKGEEEPGFRVVIDRVFIGLNKAAAAMKHLEGNQTVGKVILHVNHQT